MLLPQQELTNNSLLLFCPCFSARIMRIPRDFKNKKPHKFCKIQYIPRLIEGLKVVYIHKNLNN